MHTHTHTHTHTYTHHHGSWYSFFTGWSKSIWRSSFLFLSVLWLEREEAHATWKAVWPLALVTKGSPPNRWWTWMSLTKLVNVLTRPVAMVRGSSMVASPRVILWNLKLLASLLACFGVVFGETRGLVLSALGPSWGIGWGGPSGEDSISQSGSPPMLSSPQIVLFLSLVLTATVFCWVCPAAVRGAFGSKHGGMTITNSSLESVNNNRFYMMAVHIRGYVYRVQAPQTHFF